MNKLIVLFMAAVISFSIYADNIEISLIVVGNYNGNYDKLAQTEYSIQKAVGQNPKVIKISRGDNISSNRIKNSSLYDFYKKNNFDFNFLGKTELMNQEFIENNFYTSLNFYKKDVEPYRLIRRENFTICIAGISDGYDINGLQMLDYEVELKKLIRKAGNEADFLFIVSDLTRAENIKILSKYPEIAAIFESGYNSSIDVPVRREYGYIIPANFDSIINMIYSEKYSKIWKEASEESRLKSIYIREYDSLEKFNEEKNENLDIKNSKEKMEKELNDSQKEIIGYNKSGFYREEISFTDKIPFIDDTCNTASNYYDADYVFVPVNGINKGLKKGIYSKGEVENFFTKNKVVICELPQDTIEKIKYNNEKQRGTESKIYIYKSYKSRINSKYVVVLTEDIIDKLDRNDLNILYRTNLTMNDFIPRGNHEKK